ncbi:hypothetical protein pb186bvf_018454 [Paramecium bursaria]
MINFFYIWSDFNICFLLSQTMNAQFINFKKLSVHIDSTYLSMQ